MEEIVEDMERAARALHTAEWSDSIRIQTRLLQRFGEVIDGLPRMTEPETGTPASKFRSRLDRYLRSPEFERLLQQDDMPAQIVKNRMLALLQEQEILFHASREVALKLRTDPDLVDRRIRRLASRQKSVNEALERLRDETLYLVELDQPPKSLVRWLPGLSRFASFLDRILPVDGAHRGSIAEVAENLNSVASESDSRLRLSEIDKAIKIQCHVVKTMRESIDSLDNWSGIVELGKDVQDLHTRMQRLHQEVERRTSCRGCKNKAMDSIHR